ncbi:MAG: OmpA family protein [Chitinophagales bacterium]|jgi:outer membrane protein OmpA-like peptidoglycan-associated protein|nr:OmpA family protein [Chitinophagales bacterium]
MKNFFVYAALGLIVAFSSCNQAEKTDNNTTDNNLNDSDMVLKKDNEVSQQEKQETNWNDVDFTSPIVKYDEVSSKDIDVRGNDQYTIYSINEDILFASGQSSLSATAESNLTQIAASISQRYPEGKIRVYGYTDSIGSKQENKDLSRARAEAVRNFLVSNGQVAEDRIDVNAEGEKKPVASNETAEGRKQNRRVEIVARK